MSLVNTGVGKVTGIAASIDNSIMLFDGTTGELTKQSSATISAAGDITANKFIGDGSQLTNLPGGAGSGDVVGPASSIDFRVPTFDGVTGRLLRQSPVSISNTGVMLGVTSFSVDDIILDNNTLTATVDKVLSFFSSGAGGFDFTTGTAGLVMDDLIIKGNTLTNKNDGQDVVIANNLGGKFQVHNDTKLTKSLTVDGFTTINDKVKINYGSDPAIEVQSSTGTVGLRIRQGVVNQSTIMDFRDHQGARKGWFGYGSSSDRNQAFWSNEWGGITIAPKTTNELITMKGFTKLGEGTLNIGVKMYIAKGTSSSSSTGSIQIPHSIPLGKILSITGHIAHVTGRGITPGYEAGGGSFDWDVWWDAFNIHVINSGSSITSKPVNLLVTYIE